MAAPAIFSRKADTSASTESSETFMLTTPSTVCLLYTSDAADERSSVDLGGRRIIKQKNKQQIYGDRAN